MNNFYPLPEWYPQSATVIVWPHRYSDWSHMLDDIQQTYVALIKAITRYQPVIVVYFNDAHKAAIIQLCVDNQCDMQCLSFVAIETNDTWIRDYGPQILLGATGHQYIDCEFNAWGEQYPWRLDNLFAEQFYEYLNTQRCEYHRIPLVIEGGNLEFDSQANLLTNLACIRLNNPNFSLSDEAIIENLRDLYSLKQVLSIDVPALKGDDTGGHIDTLARFVNDDTIVYSSTDDADNPNHSCLLLLKDQLMTLKNKQGKAYQLIPIPLPKTVFLNGDDDYLPASYVNFLFINHAIIVPLHQDEHDQVAIDRLSQACPERKIIGVNANTLVQQFGSLHCATLHLPENILRDTI